MLLFNETYEQSAREAELEELRRLQGLRAVTRAAETEGSVTRSAETEDSSSDESKDEYFEVATEFAAKREAAKGRAAENFRRSYRADHDQGSKATRVAVGLYTYLVYNTILSFPSPKAILKL